MPTTNNQENLTSKEYQILIKEGIASRSYDIIIHDNNPITVVVPINDNTKHPMPLFAERPENYPPAQNPIYTIKFQANADQYRTVVSIVTELSKNFRSNPAAAAAKITFELCKKKISTSVSSPYARNEKDIVKMYNTYKNHRANQIRLLEQEKHQADQKLLDSLEKEQKDLLLKFHISLLNCLKKYERNIYEYEKSLSNYKPSLWEKIFSKNKIINKRKFIESKIALIKEERTLLNEEIKKLDLQNSESITNLQRALNESKKNLSNYKPSIWKKIFAKNKIIEKRKSIKKEIALLKEELQTLHIQNSGSIPSLQITEKLQVTIDRLSTLAINKENPQGEKLLARLSMWKSLKQAPNVDSENTLVKTIG